MFGIGSGSRWPRALGLLLGLTWSQRAGAQDQQAENIAAARALGIQGVQLADAGKCLEAIDKLSRAVALYAAPTILGRLGECQVAAGQVVLGTENLNKVVREQLAPNAPKAFRNAQERAAKVLETALPRIAYLTVEIEPKDAKPAVTVDGANVPNALIGAERPTDPGKHEVVAVAPGYVEARTSVELGEGTRQTVTLRLTLDPNTGAATPAPEAARPGPVAPPPADSSGGGSKTLSYVLLGVGAVGIATGGVTGFLALQKKGDLDCPDKKCSGNQADALDSANTLATISTIGFGVGVAAVAVGVVLLVTSGGSKDAPQTGTAARLVAKPYLGLGTAGVVGTF